MVISLKKIIEEVAEELKISPNIVKDYISGELGTRWIYEKSLECSEVELSMFLKTIRKRLSYDFCYYFTSSVKKEKEIPLLQALYKRYMEFDNLHLQFFNGKNNLSKSKQE